MPNRGSWFRALEIGRRMIRHGHRVTLMATSSQKLYRPEVRVEPDGLEIMECGNWTLFNDHQEGWGLFDIASRLNRIPDLRPNLVYGFSHKPCCLLPALLARLLGARLVLDWSDWWGGPEGLYKSSVLSSFGFLSLALPVRLARRFVFELEGIWEARCLEVADRVTLISDEFYTHPQVPSDLYSKALTLYSGSDLNRIVRMEQAQARHALSEELHGIPSDAVILGYLANYNPDEALMLNAFAQICDQRDDVWLLAVGAGFDHTSPEIQERIKHRVRHVGFQPFERVGLFLGASDLLLLPLDNRKLNRARYPHKLSDYVAAGRPIVACDVGMAGQLIHTYNIGFLSSPNSEEFASAINTALSMDRVALDSLGAHVRRMAEEHWDWDVLCDRLFEFLEI